jgi:hypothetical protein
MSGLEVFNITNLRNVCEKAKKNHHAQTIRALYLLILQSNSHRHHIMKEQAKPSSAIQALNLPPAQLRLRHGEKGDEIFDPLRGKWLVLTPEEWVRQNFISWLISDFGYPAGLMANETAINLNGTSKRCDTVVYSHAAKPIMIVEYKAPHVAITQKVFEQIARYNIVLRVKYLTVSNGLHHYCCMLDEESGRYRFLKEIPAYEALV